jgi:hypothetical protein
MNEVIESGRNIKIIAPAPCSCIYLRRPAGLIHRILPISQAHFIPSTPILDSDLSPQLTAVLDALEPELPD